MPFTIAHTVAARPLWRLSDRRLVQSALAVGAMAPDFEYLVHLNTRRTIGHTLLGVFVLCLPTSLALLGIWYRLVGPAVARLLPPSLDGLAAVCVLPFSSGTPRPAGRFATLSRLVTVCASIVIGAFSHIAWDSFTHSSGAMVSRLGFLQWEVWDHGPGLYKVLQYASGVAGMAVLGWWAYRLEAVRAPAVPAVPPRLPRRVQWLAWVVVAGSGALLATANATRVLLHGRTGVAPIVAAVLGVMTGSGFALLAASLVLKARASFSACR